jgi:multidrug transporter EmrE-like cation transporter
VLKKLPLTIAHPITGIVFILVPIMSHALWGEPLPPARIAGIAIVIVGICLVARAK